MIFVVELILVISKYTKSWKIKIIKKNYYYLSYNIIYKDLIELTKPSANMRVYLVKNSFIHLTFMLSYVIFRVNLNSSSALIIWPIPILRILILRIILLILIPISILRSIRVILRTWSLEGIVRKQGTREWWRGKVLWGV